MFDETRTTDENVSLAIRTIVDTLNGGNQRVVAESILKELRHTHRTLQQKFWSAMILVTTGYAEFDFDLRNQAAVEHAKAVKQLTYDRGSDHGLPLI